MAHLEYLVHYGRAGALGRFRAGGPLALSRGAAVVVRAGAGPELGEVLRPATALAAAHFPDVAGEIVRPAGAADLAAAGDMAERAGALAARAGELAEALRLPVAPLDAEVTLDGGHAALFLVRWAECDLRDLVWALSNEFALTLAPVDLTAPQEEGGCGSCGSGGGCGSGSCASASPEEVRDYFAGLREKMERRVSLL